MIKKHFFTGFALLFPLVVTLLLVIFFVNVLTRPFQGFVEEVLRYYGLLGKPFLFLSASQVLVVISKALIIATLVGLAIFMGFLAQTVVTHYVIRMGDYVIHKIPVVNKIYKATQDVVKTLFADKKKAFSQVVLVPFPSERSYSIGMVTSENISPNAQLTHEGLITVFVPGTPNPTMGFLLMFKRSQIIETSLGVDDAIKAIVSCGVTLDSLSKNK